MRKVLDGLCAFILLSVFACSSKTPAEKEAERIEAAKIFLSSNQCDKAIEILEAEGTSSVEANYIQVRASAYACRAGFSEIGFFANEVAKVSSASTNFLNTLATFSTSNDEVADSPEFMALHEAIQILLYSGGISESSATTRATTLGQGPGNDINIQAIFLLLVQLGKFLNLYGNTDSLGVKGAGEGTNNCFFNYTGARAIFIASEVVETSSCQAPIVGHPDLDTSETAASVRRLCYGLTYFTNLYDLLQNTTLSTSDELGSLGDVFASIDSELSSLETFFDVSILEVRDQSSCEQRYQDPNASEFDELEGFYAGIFETLL